MDVNIGLNTPARDEQSPNNVAQIVATPEQAATLLQSSV
jgi:hypothetical protein